MSSKFGFNSEKFYQDLKQYMIYLVDDLTEEIYRSMLSGLNSQVAKDDLVMEPTIVESYTEYTQGTSGKEFINSRIRAYVFAVLDSFGTGNGIDNSSPYLDDYKSSEYWNPARSGNRIVGRPHGTYTDIFGNDSAYSSGKMEGKPVLANNISASRAIQSQENWLIKNGETKIERTVKTFVDQFIAKNGYKYFRSGSGK